MNTGVKLLEDNNVLETLKIIKKHVSNIVMSFESLQYFGLENSCKAFNKWSIGDITTILVNAKNVIKI